MNILYLSQGNYPGIQGDLLFLGLRKAAGSSVVDAPKINILYEETLEKTQSPNERLDGEMDSPSMDFFPILGRGSK